VAAPPVRLAPLRNLPSSHRFSRIGYDLRARAHSFTFIRETAMSDKFQLRVDDLNVDSFPTGPSAADPFDLHGPLFGITVDPTAATRCFICPVQRPGFPV
jgi:hypothetical protein